MPQPAEENEKSASTNSAEYDKISAGIAEAVNMVLAQDSTEGAETPVEGSPEATPKAESAPKEEPQGEPTTFAASDAEIERAVKAGLSVSDAKAFTDKAVFERIVEALEKKAAPDDATISDNGKPADDDSGEDVEVPTLPEDEDYDPKLVKSFNKMGEMLKQVLKENAELKKAGTSAEAKSFFDTQFGNMEEAVRSRVDDAGKERLRQKFKMLEAGYKATGANISREDIFNEAARLEIGDLMRDAKDESKASKIADRARVRLNPPTGENRSGAARKSEEDIDKEVARVLSDKFKI